MLNLAPARRIAWTIWIIEIGLLAAGSALMGLNRETFQPGEWATPVSAVVFGAAYATMGAVIVARRPGNLIGWLFSFMALPMALQAAAQEYAICGYVVAPQALPALRLAAWLQSWLTYLVFPAPLALPYLLFPTGRLPSPRWRPLVVLIVLSSCAAWFAAFTSPGNMIVYRGDRDMPLPVTNPTGVYHQPVLLNLLSYNWPLALLAYAITIVAGFVRFLHSRGDERQQIKWLAFLGVLALAFNLAGLLLPAPFQQWGSVLGLTLVILSAPLAAGLAILRYRLYDIDRIINRTVVYGLLSATLSVVYFGSLAFLQQLLPSQSPLAIVASTLLMAVLFAPLRARIQAVIDRRFHRRRYDAQRILQAFSAAARDEVDLDRLSGELQAAVQQSVEPASVMLWLRERPPSM